MKTKCVFLIAVMVTACTQEIILPDGSGHTPEASVADAGVDSATTSDSNVQNDTGNHLVTNDSGTADSGTMVAEGGTDTGAPDSGVDSGGSDGAVTCNPGSCPSFYISTSEVGFPTCYHNHCALDCAFHYFNGDNEHTTCVGSNGSFCQKNTDCAEPSVCNTTDPGNPHCQVVDCTTNSDCQAPLVCVADQYGNHHCGM